MKKTPKQLNRLSPTAFLGQAKRPVVMVMDNIRSAHNIGAAFRLADAFLIEKIYLCGLSPYPPHPQIRKTALGAEEVVAWGYAPDTPALVQSLKQGGYYIIAIEQTHNALPLQHFHDKAIGQPYALVFGHEVFGISEQTLAYADIVLEIPQYGTKHSLNVSTAMAIVLWETLRE